MATKWKYLSFTAAMVISLAIGILIGHSLTKHQFYGMLREGPGHVHKVMLARLADKLGIDDEQKEAMRPAVTEFHRKVFKLREEIHPRVKAEVDALIEEVREHLTDEQYRRLLEVREEFSRKFEAELARERDTP